MMNLNNQSSVICHEARMKFLHVGLKKEQKEHNFIINWTYNHSQPIQAAAEPYRKQRSYLWEQDLWNEEPNKNIKLKLLGKA